MPRIILKFKEKALKDYPLQPGRPLTIGRQADNQIVIDNLAVSGHHARIEIQAEKVILADLKSKNGTYKNDVKITSCELRHGDMIMIGKHTLIFDAKKDAVTPNETGKNRFAAAMDGDITMMIDTRKHSSMKAAERVIPDGSAYLLSLSEEGLKIALTKSVTTFGNGPNCDIAVGGFWALFAGDPAASISKTREHYYINHVSGLIKPKVNNQAVKGSVRLKDKDLVKMGAATYQFSLSDPERK
jgi:pSer/pThr/pTyr-binding forkhead associated (FHA) protein